MAFSDEKQKQGIVIIACSTGGPAVLHTVLPSLPEEFDFPVIVVQHIWPGFAGQLASNIDEQCPFTVKKAEDQETILPGRAYIAPEGKQIRIKRQPGRHHRIVLTDEEPKGGLKPCADYLLESLADSGYERIVVAVLTGMGCDATEGLEELSKTKQIKVIVQSEESCVVYGMPGSVRTIIQDCTVLPPEEIAGEIMKLMEVTEWT